MSRNEIEIKLEYYSSHCKELSSKSLINDLINLLVSLNFVEKYLKLLKFNGKFNLI